jgi:hypothetical protein
MLIARKDGRRHPRVAARWLLTEKVRELQGAAPSRPPLLLPGGHRASPRAQARTSAARRSLPSDSLDHGSRFLGYPSQLPRPEQRSKPTRQAAPLLPEVMSR